MVPATAGHRADSLRARSALPSRVPPAPAPPAELPSSALTSTHAYADYVVDAPTPEEAAVLDVLDRLAFDDGPRPTVSEHVEVDLADIVEVDAGAAVVEALGDDATVCASCDLGACAGVCPNRCTPEQRHAGLLRRVAHRLETGEGE